MGGWVRGQGRETAQRGLFAQAGHTEKETSKSAAGVVTEDVMAAASKSAKSSSSLSSSSSSSSSTSSMSLSLSMSSSRSSSSSSSLSLSMLIWQFSHASFHNADDYGSAGRKSDPNEKNAERLLPCATVRPISLRNPSPANPTRSSD